MNLIPIFKRSISLLLFIVAGLISINTSAENTGVILSAEAWDISRHGEKLVHVKPLETIVKQWHSTPGKQIELRYPGGEEGEIWVEELKDWLVSLGVPSDSILVVPGSDAKDIINMALIANVRN